ncbi:hypothetical protein [Chitinophaga arvensicola]|uniref:NVEALA protein n=1 Tax=Chitinophaga arvensicola TaxID=29529 RepID=A0A1I0R8R5_9BACT|nr:hypothetical protein [Chitinophaga arvensicola]SEW37175.1 hypothetical protein SAMN04488122_2479 [Chitinophaga arvensicola]
MKKKTLSILGIVSLAIAAFLSTTASQQTADISLSGFLKINTASAECCSTPFNNGRCSALLGRCFADPGSTDCDAFAC